MIIYQDRFDGDRRGPPSWLAGAAELQSAEDHGGRLWAVGPGHLLGYDPQEEWQPVGDHWQAVVHEPLQPQLLLRMQRWFDARPVQDLEGRTWLAPVVHLPSGLRAFRTKYGGPSMLPILSRQQAHAELIAREARAALETAAAATQAAQAVGREPSEDDGLPMAPACRWAAELLGITHHVSPAAIAALGLLDDRLVVDVLMTCCGYLEPSRADRH